MKKQLIKVVGTVITGADGGRLETRMGRGITTLARGQTLLDYVKKFLSDRAVTTFTLNQRSANDWATSPMMYLNASPKLVITFSFTQFGIDEFSYYAKDLTKAEQARDFKLLKRYLK